MMLISAATRARRAAVVGALAVPRPARRARGSFDQRRADPLVSAISSARDSIPRRRWAALAAEAADIAAGRARTGFPSLFLGRADADPRSAGQGRLFGLDLTHTRADMYRALLEGIANATRHMSRHVRRGRGSARDDPRGRRRGSATASGPRRPPTSRGWDRRRATIEHRRLPTATPFWRAGDRRRQQISHQAVESRRLDN